MTEKKKRNRAIQAILDFCEVSDEEIPSFILGMLSIVFVIVAIWYIAVYG